MKRSRLFRHLLGAVACPGHSRRRLRRVALLPGLLAAPCAAQAAAPADAGPVVDIPLRIHGGWPVVPAVTAGGDTVDFILDTGAAQGAISRGLATRLELEPVDHVAAYGASGAADVDVVETPPLLVGGLDAGSARAIVIADSVLMTDAGEPIAGILGAPFLRRFDVLIDVPGGMVRLYERGAAPVDLASVVSPEDGLPFRASGSGLISFDATLNNEAVGGLLDTGARHVILNWPAAEQAGIQTSEDPVSERRRGVGDQIVSAHGGRIAELRLGATTWESVDAQVADLPIFRILGLAERPTLLVGAPVIRDCPLLVSYAAKTLRFCRRPG